MKYIRLLFLSINSRIKNQESTSTAECRRRPVAEHCEVSEAEAEAVARGGARMPTFQRQRRSLSALRSTASAAEPCWWRRMLPKFKTCNMLPHTTGWMENLPLFSCQVSTLSVSESDQILLASISCQGP
jgi:hypothetical protein